MDFTHKQRNAAPLHAGVIGWPITHSLSPRLHTFWLQHYGINGRYDAYAVPHDDLCAFVNGLHQRGVRGVNVTIPHKQAVLPLMTTLEATAQRVGAVNTIVVQDDGTLHGANTDVEGFYEAVRQRDIPHDLQGGYALILGCGGAARAVIAACEALGIARIVVAARTPSRAQTLVEDMGIRNATLLPWLGIAEALSGASLVVNTTPLGLKGYDDLVLDWAGVPRTTCVADIVYGAMPTRFLASAHAQGLTTIDGLAMLVYQAVPVFERFFGVRPKVTEEIFSLLRSTSV